MDMSPGPAAQPARILVVDDEPSILMLVSMVLAEEGFVLAEAATLAEARAQVARSTFDLVLSDKNLPDGIGLELLRDLDTDRTAFVLMTAYASLDSAVEALRLGAIDYLEKPFDLDRVLACVRRALKMQALARENRRLVEDLQRKNGDLAALAVRDPLTRLFNHAHLQESLEREIARSTRSRSPFGLMLLDVDGFKGVNDTEGHLAGDRVLEALARIIDGRAAQSGTSTFRLRGHDVAARIGGDEFAILLPDADPSGLEQRAEQLRAEVERHSFPGGRRPTVSIGVASWPDHGLDRVAFFEAADRALYAAKRTGRNRVVPFSDALAAAPHALAEVESLRAQAVRRVIEGELVSFVYQPIVRASGAAFGFEGLCRPTHPDFQTPMALLEAAEHAGELAALSRILRRRCAAGLALLPADAVLFLNLHPQDLADPRLLDVDPALRALAPRIVFEITEVSRLNEYGRVRDVMGTLRGAGFRFALDDLGSGYSGLNSLAMLAPEFVKLDLSLVRASDSDARARRLVRHVIEFARDEGMQVVAEGIETPEQRDTVVGLGVDLLQGFLIGRPRALEREVTLAVGA